MTDNQGKPNTSFALSDKESPTKKNNSSILGIFKKKPDTTANSAQEAHTNPIDGQIRQTPQQQQQQDKAAKAKLRNRESKKNIAHGQIKLIVAESDKVQVGSDYRENPYEILDQNPMRTTSYIENLRSRDFSQINNREVKRFIENRKQQKDIRPNLHVENIEIELLDVAKTYETFLAKFFRFFQGLLPGFCVIHLFLIFGGGTDQTILNSYVLSGLRISQIFYVVALISTLGALNRYIETRSQYKESIRSQPMLKEALGRQATKYLIASICFLVTYAIIVFNHEFVAKTSDVSGTVNADDFTKLFRVFRALSVVMTALSLIGWCSLILAFEEISKSPNETLNYDELTGDESFIEMA